jgi:CMP-N-acetylneuraminic acid synthetase/beta-phosphoglucomutase-like phosphatase (HAD superfamily)
MLGERPLSHYIFETLLAIPEIKEVFCYTSQPNIIPLLPDGVKLLVRPSRLDGDDIKANELFNYAVKNIDAEILVLAQVPGPFITIESIRKGIKAVVSHAYDSAFSVQRIQKYCWHADNILNYSTINMVQTQDLEPIYAETSGFYVFKRDDYLHTDTRINGKSFFVEVSDKEAIDIDYTKDFELATQLLNFNQSLEGAPIQNSFVVNLAKVTSLNKKIKHVVFDMNSILINDTYIAEASWDHAMKATKLLIPFSAYKDHAGKSFRDIFTILKIPSDLFNILTEEYEKKSVSLIESAKVFHGIDNVLNRISLTNAKISIVSLEKACIVREVTDKFFSKIQFDALITPESIDSGRVKPNPSQLLLACIKVGADPSKTVYISNMKIDRLTSERAGINFIHAAWGCGKDIIKEGMWFDKVDNFSEFLIGTLIE